MKNQGIRPSDILSDSDDYVDLNGLKARKGSIAAFLKNIEIIEREESDTQLKESALNIIRELAPVVIASGLHKHAVFKNNFVQELLDKTAKLAL